MQAIQRQPVPSQQQLDNLVEGIQQHKAVHCQKAWAARKPEQCKHLVSKLILLAVAKSQERLKTLAAIIAGATDRQNVAECAECAKCAEAVLCNRNFIAAVNAAGIPEVALAMVVFANGYFAAAIRGASLAAGCTWFHHRNLFISKVFALHLLC